MATAKDFLVVRLGSGIDPMLYPGYQIQHLLRIFLHDFDRPHPSKSHCLMMSPAVCRCSITLEKVDCCPPDCDFDIPSWFVSSIYPPILCFCSWLQRGLVLDDAILQPSTRCIALSRHRNHQKETRWFPLHNGVMFMAIPRAPVSDFGRCPTASRMCRLTISHPTGIRLAGWKASSAGAWRNMRHDISHLG